MTTDDRRTSGGLGRGLAALIPQRQEGRGTVELPISAIARNPYQPRRSVEMEALQQLSASIAEHGVLQPVLVTETIEGYRLIAGERRLRAAEMAGLERIPALVRSVEDDQQLALALIENLQRSDLNPVEEAHAYRQLIDDFSLTQEEVARRIGRSRPSITNSLRLLELAPFVLGELELGTLSEGHARAIAGLDDAARQEEVARLVIGRGMSVRQTEEFVRRLRDGQVEPAPRASRRPAAQSPELERLENGLRTALGTKVSLTPGRRGGRITIEYYDNEDLDRLYERLTGTAS
ncbi:MAG TPA: ParB/RepB/Spo0J family partition protein [Candidatus Limnocylindria bacterium]|nr:ParB/RepB/Spo0J family partition protein [Candidatus Limnocylindria bacterium]